MKILIVEDEPGIISFIKEGLKEEGFEVDTATDGNKGLEMALSAEAAYDLLLLDWMLPGIAGIEICRQVRENESNVPVIFLTAKDTVPDTIFALDTGANDYIRKPFSFEELLARVRVQLRNKSETVSQLSYQNLLMDLDKHQVFQNDKEVLLTRKEFALLKLLLKSKGKVCSRINIIEQVWDIHFDYDTSVIDVYINSLRKKLDQDSKNSLIRTIRGVGYMISET